MDSRLLSIVIPTITGREHWLHKCLESYARTSPDAEFIVIKDAPTCGHAWIEGWEKSTREYVQFTADDIEPAFYYWFDRAVEFISEGIVPACNVVNAAGDKMLCDSPLGDLGSWPNVLVPLLHRDWLKSGGWLLPIHYGSDDWVTYWAVTHGYDVRRCQDYKMQHNVASEGRNYLRRHGDIKMLADAMRESGYLPPVYEQLEINLRTSATGLDNVSIHQLNERVQNQLKEQHRRNQHGH